MKKQLGGAAGFRKGWLLLLLLSLAFILPGLSAEAFQRGGMFKTGFGRESALAGLVSRVDGKIAELRGERTPGSPRPAPTVGKTSGVRLEAGYGRFPLLFEENGGQTAPEVAFTVKGRDKTLYFTPEGLTFSLAMPREAEGKTSGAEDPESRRLPSRPGGHGGPGEALERWTLKLDFVGAGRVRPEGKKPAGTVVSYFKGPEREHRPGVPTYSSIVYRDLWPGIDLVYDGDASHLKYRFVVRPGADPDRIRLACRGAERLSVNGDGGLEIVTAAGVLRDDAPLSWQETGEGRIPVKVSYALGRSDAVGSGPNTPLDYGFSVENYDPARELVIDPVVLVYCGYIGGSGADYGNGIAVDESGCAYVTGATYSDGTSFPVAAGPDVSYNGGADAFVAKVNAAGTGLDYCGYIGGSGNDYGFGIAVDGSGSVYVTGGTWSDDFPVKVGPDLTYNGGADAFVAKVNAAGTGLVYCGYIGGSGNDYGYGIAVDGSGCAYVTGATYSDGTSFPVAAGPDLTYNGAGDAFVAKVNAAGGLVYCGYIGGSGNDDGTGIAVDGSGCAYVTGYTNSGEATFPVKAGPGLTFNGGADAFVAKVTVDGGLLVYCGYIGGTAYDYGNGIAVDGPGSAYVTGETLSGETTFPVKVGPDVSHNGGVDAFVAKVSAAGTGLVYCGYIGGSGDDYGYGIAVDGSGCAYVAGYTKSDETTFPVKVGPDLTYNGAGDAFVAKVTVDGGLLVYCGYIGGSGGDSGNGIAVDGPGSAYVTGETLSGETTFPVAAGPGLTFNGGRDAFVAKIADEAPVPSGRKGSGGCSALGSGAYALLLALPLAALAFGRK